MDDQLKKIKHQQWFYEFDLPDGSKTESYLPEAARKIHVTRAKALRSYLDRLDDSVRTALDISCHEGYFSHILADRFREVVAFDTNGNSLDKARLIAAVTGRQNIQFENSSVELWSDERSADFVLCFGLLYHVENPIEIMRKLATLARKAVCIETQVLPFNMVGHVEDGNCLWQRDLHGLFGLCVDYADRTEGGLTNLALVPSRNALDFLLREVGFQSLEFYAASPGDYEQYTRQHRVIVFAEK